MPTSFVSKKYSWFHVSPLLFLFLLLFLFFNTRFWVQANGELISRRLLSCPALQRLSLFFDIGSTYLCIIISFTGNSSCAFLRYDCLFFFFFFFCYFFSMFNFIHYINNSPFIASNRGFPPSLKLHDVLACMSVSPQCMYDLPSLFFPTVPTRGV